MLGGDDVGGEVGALQQLDLSLGEERIVDVGDDRPVEVRVLAHVEAEKTPVAPRGATERGRVERCSGRVEGAVPEPARDPPVREREQVGVEPLEPRQQLGVARVVVALEPDVQEADPVASAASAR